MKIAWYIAACSVALSLAGCSKTEEPTAPPPAPPETHATRPTDRSPAATAPATPASAPALPATQPSVLPPSTTPTHNAGQVEVEYLQAPDLVSKMSALDDLSEADPADAVATLGRLFYFEKDNSVREEILNQLVYIDGVEAAKIELLGEAVKPNQPAAIRHAAIDLMVELADLSAVPVLQRHTNDRDPAIREAVVDAIEELRNPE